ncbi:Chromatin modification-related protein png1 [Leucoagaricus sp. SymC.cos]|nr:Chromatin modification-related protein png1 [Leucoagaricus sp. SymC.cos]
MVNPRAAAPVASSSQSRLNTAYSLALLSEFTHTLDSLPLDLSRSIGDLRELDAVLSSSMINITAKIHDLTCMIEERRGTKEERLWLLHEIAEEAARLKYGGDDKIRVACTAADTLKAHSAHLHSLAERMPDFDVKLLKRRTAYPHVSDKSFMPLNMDTGRRRRGGVGSSGLLVNANHVDPSPAKRKRIVRDEEIDIGGIRSPHKRERLVEPNPRSRLGRAKKNERVPSPSESLVSVTSHLPSQNAHTNGTSARSGRNANGTGAANKRRGGGVNSNNNSNRVSTPSNDYSNHNPSTSNRGNGLQNFSSHASNLATHANGAGAGAGDGGGGGGGVLANGNAGHYYNGDNPHSVSGTPDINVPQNQLLAGPGVVPFARSASVHSNVTNVNGAGAGGRNGSVNTANSVAGAGDGVAEAGDVDGDNDDGRTYCFCDGVSYGEMIACDDESCEREWFHLSCIGLTVCPEGSWFCDTCKNKRNNKRPGRGGKRRAAGNRAGGKA